MQKKPNKQKTVLCFSPKSFDTWKIKKFSPKFFSRFHMVTMTKKMSVFQMERNKNLYTIWTILEFFFEKATKELYGLMFF